MSRFHLFLLPFLMLMAQPAQAYCAGWEIDGLRYYSVTKEFARADFVAIVRVQRETWLGEDGRPKPLKPPFQFNNPRPWGFDSYMGAYYDVRVVKVYKGRPARHERLFSENSTARFWLRPGREYVVFVSKGAFDAPIGKAMTVDTCGNSPILRRQARTLIAKLTRLSR